MYKFFYYNFLDESNVFDIFLECLSSRLFYEDFTAIKFVFYSIPRFSLFL